MAHDTKIKTCLLRKDDIQGTAKKTWPKDEAKGIPMRCAREISERSKGVPQDFSQTEGL